MKTVWIVVGYRVSRNAQPFRHPTFEDACVEAQRLSHENPGTWFNVYKLKRSFRQEKALEIVEGDQALRGATAGVENAVAAIRI